MKGTSRLDRASLDVSTHDTCRSRTSDDAVHESEADQIARFVRQCQIAAGAWIPPTDSVYISSAVWTALRASPDVRTPANARRVAAMLSEVARRTMEHPAWRIAGADSDEADAVRIRVTAALNLIFREHRSPAVSLRTVSEELRLSKWYLCHLSKSISGHGFPTHLNGLRVLSAITCLTQGDDDIAAIARTCGYGHTSMLDRYFHTFIRMSPTRFRRLIVS